MKKLTINLKGITSTESNVIEVKSEAAMWNVLRSIRDHLTDEELGLGAQAIVTTEDGTPFKDITFKKNSKGKIEMPNAIKETCRRQIEKARKAEKEAAEKLAAKKAAKAAANRRYREKKKAMKAAMVANEVKPQLPQEA